MKTPNSTTRKIDQAGAAAGGSATEGVPRASSLYEEIDRLFADYTARLRRILGSHVPAGNARGRHVHPVNDGGETR